MRQRLACLAVGISLLAQGPPPAEDPDACRIHGQLVDEAGAPVAGVQLSIKGSRAGSARRKRFGLPSDWVDPGPFVTDEEGRFDIRFIPPQAFRFLFQCTHPELADLGWRWDQIGLGEDKDLGEVLMERPGVIGGQIVDGNGELLAKGWRVMAYLQSFVEHHRGISTKHVPVDAEQGHFRIQDLPPGKVQLTAKSLTGEHSKAVYVNTTAGDETWIELTHKGANVRNSIFLDFTARPFSVDGKWLAASEMWAVDAKGKSWPVTRDDTGWSATGLAPGQYTVRVDSPWYQTWRADDVKIGTRLRVQLVGRGALALRVLDPSGEPLSAYGVRLRPMGSTAVIHVRGADREPPPGGLHTGLAPGEYELMIEAPGFVPCFQRDVRVLVDESPEVTVRMEPVIPLVGRVLDAAGLPAAGLLVQATPGEQAGHNGPWPSGMLVYRSVDGEPDIFQLPRYQDEDTTDAEGYFRLGNVGRGPHTLRLFISPWARADELVDVRDATGEVTMRLPPLGSIEGRVVFDGERPDGYLTVDQPSKIEGIHLVHMRADSFGGAKVDRQGRFRLGPLIVGLQEFVFRATRTSSSGASRVARTVFRVDVAEGAPTPYALDLAPEPNSIRADLHFTLGGQALGEGIGINLIPLEQWNPSGRRRKSRLHQLENGTCQIDALPFGDYEVHITSGAWKWRFPESLVSGPSGSKFNLDVPLLERTVHVVDAQGRPRPGAQVWYGLHPRRLSGGPSITDGQGHLQLALVPGAYHFGLQQQVSRKNIPKDPSAVTWEAGSGPIQLVLQ